MQNEYRPERALNDPPISTGQQYQAKRIVSKQVCEKNDDTTNYFCGKMNWYELYAPG